MRLAITNFCAAYLAMDAEGPAWQVLGPRTLLAPLFEAGAKTVGEAPVPELALEAFGPRLLAEAGLQSDVEHDPERLTVVVGSSKGQPQLMGDRDPPEAVEPQMPWAVDWAARSLGHLTGAQGPWLAPAAACASGAHAIALAAGSLLSGQADWALAGGFELGNSPMVRAGYRRLGALSRGGVMRPFDRRRDGFVPNQGAGVLLLEREDAARRRGADILGLVSGWSLMADASHMTALCPSGNTIARAVRQALRRAGALRVDYVNAHATATKTNDVTESRGILTALGGAVPCSGTKPLTGHLLGAAGAVEAAITVLAMRQNYAPPTLHLEQPDEGADLDYIPLEGREVRLATAVSTSYGFGGHIGVLVFERE